MEAKGAPALKEAKLLRGKMEPRTTRCIPWTSTVIAVESSCPCFYDVLMIKYVVGVKATYDLTIVASPCQVSNLLSPYWNSNPIHASTCVQQSIDIHIFIISYGLCIHALICVHTCAFCFDHSAQVSIHVYWEYSPGPNCMTINFVTNQSLWLH